jgi:hypothetical protein
MSTDHKPSKVLAHDLPNEKYQWLFYVLIALCGIAAAIIGAAR